MTIEFKLPELSENAKEGTVTSIMIKVGQAIKADQNVFEIEAGKATVEIPCPHAGTVTAIHVKEGEKAKVGQLVLTIDESGAPAAAAVAAKAQAPAKAAPAPVAAPVAAAEPAKPVAPKPAPVAAPRASAPISSTSSASVPAAPSTRQFAREIGVDINDVGGTGAGGRVSVEDVKRHSRELHANRGSSQGPIAPPLPDFGKWGAIETESLSNVRAATAQHMAVSWSNIPHVTIHESIDVTGLEDIRKANKAKAEKAGLKLTMTPFLIKIMASALKVHPKFNTSLDLANNQLIIKKYVNIGVAMDTERGLVVPVLRNADTLSVMKIADEISKLAERAKARKISPDDMQGGGMTITNIGGIGGSFFTPIVNFPEVAILGVGRATVQPVQINGFFQPRLMLPLSLSFDHRVIDGADGARFLRWMNDAIQQPVLLTLEG